MTTSSHDIHDVTEVRIDKTNHLEDELYTRHIRVICKDQYGSTHHHTITLYASEPEQLDKFNQED